MLKPHKIALGFLAATAIWSVVFVLQSDASAYFQICETNQYTDQEHCTSHHLLYVAIWYVGYVINPTSITAYATVAIAWFTWTLRNSTERLWLSGERHSERELRAFVFAKAIGVTPETVTRIYTINQMTWEDPVSWVVTVIWENSGETRTKNMFMHVSHQFFDGEMPNDFSFPDLGDQTRVPTMIGPRAIMMSSGFKFEVSDPSVLLVFENKKHLYIWGWAEYDDIFENTARHRTEFCYEIFFVGVAFPGKAQLAHRMHRLHNAADEDCKYPLKTPRS